MLATPTPTNSCEEAFWPDREAKMVRCSEQDAHKGRPYYGRGWFSLEDGRVKWAWRVVRMLVEANPFAAK